MAIFSSDVDTVRIIGTLLIFIFSIIGAGVPIVVARTWGAAFASITPSTAQDPEGHNSQMLSKDDASPLSRYPSKLEAKEEIKSHKRRQNTLKFIQHLFLALGSGVIVATAMLHMLPDGGDDVMTGYQGLWGSTSSSSSSDSSSNARSFEVASLLGNVSNPNNTIPPTDAPSNDDDDYPYGYLFGLAGIVVMFMVESEMHRALGAYDHVHEDDEAEADTTSYGTATAIVSKAAERQYRRELAEAKAYSAKAKLLEIAVASHSVIIGVAFGALTSAKASDPLALALIFHQFCEGFAVGAVFEKAFRAPPGRPALSTEKVSSVPAEPKYWFLDSRHIYLSSFVLLFAMSVPIGIFIGIGIANSGTDPDSPGSLFARGALECFAGGVLLYVGCVEFLGGLFSSHQHSHESEQTHLEVSVDRREDEDVSLKQEGRAHTKSYRQSISHAAPEGHILQTDNIIGRLCTYLLVLVGASAMAIIAKWA